MTNRRVPRLSDLANQSLLRDEATAIAALKWLPRELFPPLFTAAAAGRHLQTLKAMVQAWPFAYLPLGALVKAQQPPQDIVRAVLDALDSLLAHDICPRRGQLRVLDLRLSANTNFWNAWSATDNGASASSLMEPEAIQPRVKRQKLDDDGKTVKKQPSAPLQLVLDLCLLEATPDEFLTFLLQRVKQSKGRLHLCCRKLKIVAMPLQDIEKILKMVQLDYIQEVDINSAWELSTLASFAPHLGQMIHLSRLCLSHITTDAFAPQVTEEVEKLVAQFSSQLLRLRQLEKLQLGSAPFLKGHLGQLLRCLRSPLEALVITNCLLLESDLAHLSSCPNTSHLRYLNLRDVNLSGLSSEFLHVLLERNSATLHHLNLDRCGITDSQLTTILPALGHCSRLITFSFCGNPVSMAVLEDLLRLTLPLSRFRLGVFPVPLECYLGIQGTLHLGCLRGYLSELRMLLHELGQPNSTLLSDSAWNYDIMYVK